MGGVLLYIVQDSARRQRAFQLFSTHCVVLRVRRVVCLHPLKRIPQPPASHPRRVPPTLTGTRPRRDMVECAQSATIRHAMLCRNGGFGLLVELLARGTAGFRGSESGRFGTLLEPLERGSARFRGPESGRFGALLEPLARGTARIRGPESGRFGAPLEPLARGTARFRGPDMGRLGALWQHLVRGTARFRGPEK